jgi:hypothetical protein
MARVWSQSQRKDGELLVMLALADFANDAGESWPSIPTLAQKARLTERQTRRVLSKLETVGEIRRIRSNGGRNRRSHYFITLAENPDIITGKKLQGKNNTVIDDPKTLTPVSGALNHHRTVNKRGARITRPQAERNPEIREFIGWFVAEYPNRMGEPYHVKDGKDGRLVESLLATFGIEELKQRTVRLWVSSDPFIARTDRGIGILANQINRLGGTKHRANYDEDYPEMSKAISS